MKSGEGGRSRMKSVCVSACTKGHSTALPASPKLESDKIAMGNSVSERALEAIPQGIALFQLFLTLPLYQPQTRQCDRSVSPNTCDCHNLCAMCTWHILALSWHESLGKVPVRPSMSWKLLAMLSTKDFDILWHALVVLWPLHRLHFASNVMAHVSVWISMCLRPWTEKSDNLSSLCDPTWRGENKNNVSLTPPFCRQSWNVINTWILSAIWEIW